MKLDISVIVASTTATDNTNVGTTSCTAPSSNADVCYHVTASNDKNVVIIRRTTGSFTISILGNTKDELNETFAFRLEPDSLAHSDGWTRNSNTLTLTITDDDDPVAGVAIAEGDSATYTVVLNTKPGGQVTVTPSSHPTAHTNGHG